MNEPPFDYDTRVTLCDVAPSADTLSGVADEALRDELRAYATGRGVRLEVTFPAPTLQRIVAGRTPMFAGTTRESATISDVGFGARVRTYDRRDGFVRVATVHDDYLGWVPEAAVGDLPEPTHHLSVLRAHVYAAPRVSATRVLPLAYGAPLRVLGYREGWAEVALEGGAGYVQGQLLEPLSGVLEPSPESVVSFARLFLETPYVWGGVSAWGLDCSGLVQTVYCAHGIALPRDSDQQACIGEAVEAERIAPADLLFFPGHVALALDEARFLHANAHRMAVTIDSFADGGYGGRLRESLTGVRRVLS